MFSVDDCPQRFDPGADEHKKPITLWVLNTATPTCHTHLAVTIVTTLAVILMH